MLSAEPRARSRSAFVPSCSQSSGPALLRRMPARNTPAGYCARRAAPSATRLAAFVVTGGSNIYGSYPDIDELYAQQADEFDPKKRSAILEKMQQLVHEKAIYAPIWLLAFPPKLLVRPLAAARVHLNLSAENCLKLSSLFSAGSTPHFRPRSVSYERGSRRCGSRARTHPQRRRVLWRYHPPRQGALMASDALLSTPRSRRASSAA